MKKKTKNIYQWLAKYTSSYVKHSPTGQPPKRKYDTRWSHPQSTGYVAFVLTADQSDYMK